MPRMTDRDFQRYYGYLSLISLFLLGIILLFDFPLKEAVIFSGGFLSVSGLALFGFGLWTRRYRGRDELG